MTPEQSDDLDAALDRFEARLRRKWSFAEQRIQNAHRRRLHEQIILDDPRFQASIVRPSLDYYDNLPPVRRKYGNRLG
jgi:hypothetical protein